MNLVDGIKKNNLTVNTKGSLYYKTTYDKNLDFFSMATRGNDPFDNLELFSEAYEEDKTLALANLLYILDIRNGKGERYVFKYLFYNLCLMYPEDAKKILLFIGSLGRYDYILQGIKTPIEDDVISLIKEQLSKDMESDTPSLLAKWLPSHRAHNKDKSLAKILMRKLGMNEKTYRKTLATLRTKINIVEKNLSEKTYDKIDFTKVPTKAMLKYENAYNRHLKKEYQDYKEQVAKGCAKINTKGLFCYEIIRKILTDKNIDDELLDLMWNNQKDILKGNKTNILVMADTSGSMLNYKALPLASSIGLALYVAERNFGIFHNYFISFSDNPSLVEVRGKTIKNKVNNIETINRNTNIDKAFALLLKTAKENKVSQEEMPSHIIIISDMEFDHNVGSKEGTNFNNWKKLFNNYGYKLPTIIFWNVAGKTRGVPICKYDKDVALISGFSTNILENLLNLDGYNPVDVMLDKLKPYMDMLKES